jgi:hypothetical protein
MLLLLVLLLPVVVLSPVLLRRLGTGWFVAIAMTWALGVPTALRIAARLGAGMPSFLDPRTGPDRVVLVIALAIVVGGALRRARQATPPAVTPTEPP